MCMINHINCRECKCQLERFRKFRFPSANTITTKSNMHFSAYLLALSTLPAFLQLQLLVAGASFHSPTLLPIIQPSLFPHVPPYIKFKRANETSVPPVKLSANSQAKLAALLPQLKFGASYPSIDGVINQTGVDVVPPLENPYKWFGMLNACLRKREPEFAVEAILREPFQKYNIAPGSEQLALKKLHHYQVQRAMEKHTPEEFHFMFETYALPEEYSKFKAAAKKAGAGVSWIVKPSNGWNGRQVRMYKDCRYVPRRTKNSIVQRFFPESEQYRMSVNGSMVELRLSIVVTRFNPLLIYRYNNGYVKEYYNGTSRRASVVDGASPKHGVFLRGRDVHEEMKKVFNQLWMDNCHMSLLDQRLDDLVVKTLLITAQPMAEQVHSTLFSHYNAFQLFTFDIILDKYCKPFLLEVNRYGAISTKTNANVTRDATAPMIVDMLNLVGHHFPPYISNDSVAAIRENMIQAGCKSKVDNAITFDERLYTFEESETEKRKHKKFRGINEREEYLDTILEELLPGDLRYLMQAEDELCRARNFRRIFPTNMTFTEIDYVGPDNYYYKLQDAWETKYGVNRREGIDKLKWHAKFKHHLQTDNKAVQKNRNRADAIID